ncbi:MAG: hypothetical protein RL536_200 [Candidatus Parcubacteria bacterium]|jgi:hypothetical protein
MPVTLEILGGESSTMISPVTQETPRTLTRKKRRSSIPPRPRDSMAWGWNGSVEPVFLVRSPADPNVWIRPEERESIVGQRLREGWAFKRPKGFKMVPPITATIGWLRFKGDQRRFRYQRSDFGWNQIFEQRDDGL